MAADEVTSSDGPDSASATLRRATTTQSDSDWKPVGFSDNAGAKVSPPHSQSQRIRWSGQHPRRSEPLASRPAGRIFTGLFLILLITLPALGLWNAKFRYAVRGVVNGKVLRISPPRQGTVSAMYVGEGESVRKGQLLMAVTTLELEHELASISDELRTAQAELDARASQLTWQAEWRGDRGYKAWSEYYELHGRLADERARLDDAAADSERQLAIFKQDPNAVSDRELAATRFTIQGQTEKIEQLEAAIKQLKRRAELYSLQQDREGVETQHNPQHRRVESLEAELTRVRERIEEGMIRSPVDGRVVRILQLAGEISDPSRPAMEVVEDGSLEVMLYVPQRHVDEMTLGLQVPVRIEPHDEPINCRLVRLGHRLEKPPVNIERHFPRGAKLLPVVAEPQQPLDELVCLASEVKVAWTTLWLSSDRSQTAQPTQTQAGRSTDDQPRAATLPDERSPSL